MPDRKLPVRPDLTQLKHQAKDMLRAVRNGDAEALEEMRKYHPHPPKPANAKLADAQLALARSYSAPNWLRLVLACDLIEAIWEDDLKTVRAMVKKYPHLLHEDTTVRKSNWGRPMSYAANLGRDRIITMLHEMGATDHQFALDRAALQSKVGTALLLHKLAGSPVPPTNSLGGPAYTLSSSGTELMLGLGVPVLDENGRSTAPVEVVLGSDSRKPEEKHKILEMYMKHGVKLPDTPVMALHRGRIDLLEEHLRRDPDLARRTFSFDEIYPPEFGPHDPTYATELDGGTLLHLCVDYDEMEIARWLLAHGAEVDTRARVDKDAFGGHTALFGTVVSQPNFWMNYQNRPQVAPFTELLLEHGANPNVRASLRKQLHSGYGESAMYEYRDVTALSWGRRFHRKEFVSEPAMQLIVKAGGVE